MPKKAEKPENDMNISMPDIGGEPEPVKGDEKPLSVEEQIANLTKAVTSLTTMGAEAAEREGRYQTTMAQTLAAAPVGGPVAPVAPQAPAPVEMPDPVEDSKGFQAALIKTITDTVSSTVSAASAVSTVANANQAQADKLWSGFQEAYPELSKFPVLAEAAGRKRTEALTAAGLDASKAIAADTTGFLKGVAEMVTADLKAIRGEDGGDDKPPVNRTDGITGGSGNPLETGDPDKEDQGSFVKEIRDKQRTEGFM